MSDTLLESSQRFGSIPMEYLGYVGDELRSRGLSVADWLAEVGLKPQDLKRSDALVGIADLERLTSVAIRMAREAGLGLFIGRRLGVNSHGMVGELAVNARTVGDALLAIQQYSRLRTTLLSFKSVEQEGQIELRLQPASSLDPVAERVLAEAVLVSIQNVVREVTNSRELIDTVMFRFPRPDYGDLAENMFGVEVLYDQVASGFRASLDGLGSPLELADPDAFEVAAHICEAQLAGSAAAGGLGAQVRRLMLQPSGIFPSLDVAARQLHMHPRTLHRRLTEEGTSYREITEAVRHGLALEHLRSGRFTIKELANHLGYTDVANFRRAFKRWEGQSPATYRSQARRESTGSKQ